MLKPFPGQPGLFQLDGVQDDIKSQPVRVLDVVLIGPMMIAGGRAWSKTRPWSGLVLSLLGVATIVYNAKNYLKIERAR